MNPQVRNKVTIPTGGAGETVEVDGSVADVFEYVTSAGNTAFHLKNLKMGEFYSLKFTEDGVGSRAPTFTGQTLSSPVAGNLTPAAGAGTITQWLIQGDSLDCSTCRLVSKLT